MNNIPAGHPPQHASNGIGGGLSPHFAGSLQPRHSVKHASVVSKKILSFLTKRTYHLFFETSDCINLLEMY